MKINKDEKKKIRKNKMQELDTGRMEDFNYTGVDCDPKSRLTNMWIC